MLLSLCNADKPSSYLPHGLFPIKFALGRMEDDTRLVNRCEKSDSEHCLGTPKTSSEVKRSHKQTLEKSHRGCILFNLSNRMRLCSRFFT